jgi:hypothetical protein
MSALFYRNSIPVKGVEAEALWVEKNGLLFLVDEDKTITHEPSSTVFYQVEATMELQAMMQELNIDQYESPLYHGRIEFTNVYTGEVLRQIHAYKEGQTFEEVKLTPSIELGMNNHFDALFDIFKPCFTEFGSESEQISKLATQSPAYEIEMALKIDLRDDNPSVITRRSVYCNMETFEQIEKKLKKWGA